MSRGDGDGDGGVFLFTRTRIIEDVDYTPTCRLLSPRALTGFNDNVTRLVSSLRVWESAGGRGGNIESESSGKFRADVVVAIQSIVRVDVTKSSYAFVSRDFSTIFPRHLLDCRRNDLSGGLIFLSFLVSDFSTCVRAYLLIAPARRQKGEQRLRKIEKYSTLVLAERDSLNSEPQRFCCILSEIRICVISEIWWLCSFYYYFHGK